MYEVSNDTARYCRSEMKALAEIQDKLARIKSLIADHSELDELDGRELEDFGAMLATAIREREEAYSAYVNPPQYEPEHNWPANRNGARF